VATAVSAAEVVTASATSADMAVAATTADAARAATATLRQRSKVAAGEKRSSLSALFLARRRDSDRDGLSSPNLAASGLEICWASGEREEPDWPDLGYDAPMLHPGALLHTVKLYTALYQWWAKLLHLLTVNSLSYFVKIKY
jgi:hypothetical protein